MKKLMITLVIIILAMSLSAEYILRNAESGTKFEEFEYLQGGILFRFDFKQVDVPGIEGEITKIWKYKEICLPKTTDKTALNEIIKKEKIEAAAKPTDIKIWKDKTIKPVQILKVRVK